MSLLRPLTDFERRLIRSTDPLPAFNLKKPVTGYSPTNAAPGVRRTPRECG